MLHQLESWHCKRLTRTPLFSHLSEDALRSALTGAQPLVRAYKKGAFIAHQNTVCSRLTILIDGQLNASMIDHNGKKVTVEYLDAPRLIAPGFIYGSSPRYPVDIECSTDAIVFELSKEAFTTFLTTDHQALRSFLNLISNRAQFLSSRILYLSSRSIEEKVIQYFRDLYSKQGEAKIVLPISISEMSELFAVTRPALSRVLKQLLERDVFTRKGRHVTLKDKRFFNIKPQKSQ